MHRELMIILISLFLFLNCQLAVAVNISVAPMSSLTFGKFAIGSGGNVIVSPTGMRTKSGDVSLLTSSSGSAAQFLVSGDANTTFSVSLPGDSETTLTDGAHSLRVSDFVMSPSPPVVLDSNGSRALAVGASLIVDSGNPPGDYSGVFNITVNYE